MILTDDEFEELQNMEFSQNDWLWFYTQAVENKLLEKLKAQEPFAYFSINDYGAWEETSDPTAHALYEHPDPRVAELEAVLRECREALVKNIVGTGGRTPAAHEAIAKIDEVLK